MRAPGHAHCHGHAPALDLDPRAPSRPHPWYPLAGLCGLYPAVVDDVRPVYGRYVPQLGHARRSMGGLQLPLHAHALADSADHRCHLDPGRSVRSHRHRPAAARAVGADAGHRRRLSDADQTALRHRAGHLHAVGPAPRRLRPGVRTPAGQQPIAGSQRLAAPGICCAPQAASVRDVTSAPGRPFLRMVRMEFPVTRLRRLRRNEPMRALVRESHLQPGALILPLFQCPGEGVRREIGSMPGVFNLSVDEAVKEAEAAASLGIGGLLLFGLPESKDEQATGAWDDEGIVQRGLRALKASSAAKELVLMADVCLCEYTSHGHCGIVKKHGDDYEVENDSTLNLLAKTAVSLARAGADVVAPSDMMDGRVAAIRDV